MAIDQYYEKVDGDEAGDRLVREDSHNRVLRAPPTPTKQSTFLTKVAYLAIAVTIFLATVALVSSATVSARLPAAVEAAIAEQSTATAAAPASASTAESNTTPDMGSSAHSSHGNSDNHENTYKVGDADAPLITLGSAHRQEVESCGSTADEARAAGCVFDVMMQLWTPPQCMDSVLSERFLAKGNWTWYADSEATRAYSDEEIRKGNHDLVFVAQSYHRHHCIFAWERLVRAMRNQAPLIEELISYDHVIHCRHTTLTLPEEGAQAVRGVVAPTGFTRCASYDVWSKNLPTNKLSSVD